MKILHIVSYMTLGGIETFLMNIFREIDKSKFEFVILCTKDIDGHYDKELLDNGAKLIKIKDVKKVGFKSHYEKFSKVIKDVSPDIVHCHMSTWSGPYLKICSKLGINVRIAHSHSSGYRNKSLKDKVYNIIRNKHKKLIKKYSTKCLSCSQESGLWLFGKNNYEIVNNGISLNKFSFDSKSRSTLRRELNLSNEFVIGHIGRYTEQKNHNFIIDIIESLPSKLNYKLILVGDGELKDSILNRVNNLRKEVRSKVIFIDPTLDIYKYYNVFDLFVLPSNNEGLGIVLIEAQANNLKSVASVNVPVEADQNMSLVRFQELDINLWIEQIVDHLNNKLERTSCELSSELLEYSSKVVANKLSDLYKRLYTDSKNA